LKANLIDDVELSRKAASFKRFFLNDSLESAAEYRETVAQVAENITRQLTCQTQPYAGTDPAELNQMAGAFEFFPPSGTPLNEVLERTRDLILGHNIAVSHPHCAAHLHCPPFIAGLAAEMVITAFNQSLDSWDQGPAATALEQALCQALCRQYGFGSASDAVFTGGGTMSNFMGLLLARDHYSFRACGWNVQRFGLPPEASRFRILCSQYAHFTVAQSASLLGLGSQAVVTVHSAGFKEEPAALEQALLELAEQDLLPIAYVTTAGTTDFGEIGNLRDLAAVTRAYGLWLHVDAAYGGALMFSEKHRHRFAGIEHADSVTVDFHKLFYLPVSCGVFMLRDRAHFDYIRLHAEYLNPESNAELGIIDLVYKSIQTTRRFDALKPLLALQHVGTKTFGEMLDYTIDLTQLVSSWVEDDDRFCLAHQPTLNTVVFRYVPQRPMTPAEADRLNYKIKEMLLLSGEAIIGQTSAHGRACLKLTLLNPATEPDAIRILLVKIKRVGEEIEIESPERAREPIPTAVFA
jgi:L-2,4-diaminobutyrate decarboxylase